MWPTRLLKLKDEKPKRKRQQEETTRDFDFTTIPVQELRMVYLYCLALFKGKGTITIILDEALFGHERILHVNLEDVEPFCRLKPISYTCIAIYIWLLFGKVKKLDKANKFRFVDPYNIGHVPSTKKDTKSINKRMERRAQDLANRLVGTLSNQFVLVPCNVDEHWILTVIDPHKEEIGILDPFYSGIHDSTWKKVIEWALKMFNATMQRKGRKTLNWSIPQVPKQPDNSQCGFYAMRYMKDIIESANFQRISSLQLLFNSKSYSSVEIEKTILT
ncbi:uncharacterized protein LOC131013657 [Salvia miltiorrhiza]|uniref:uncharacterized protein LOC131013657 n=1 Tax=Salvia miltiorrhiza TaxID=226208 RepID=UPI0025AD2F96|nr:uncharacterized protein LOC131013657 [Salvia miltiorrhiza]